MFQGLKLHMGSFNNYLNLFTNNKIIYEINNLSDTILKDLIKRV